jgi:hypothetical protein
MLQPDPEPLFTPEVLAAGRAKVRQRTRDRVAEQRAVVARDYSVDWLAYVAEHPRAVALIVKVALKMAREDGKVSMGDVFALLRRHCARRLGAPLNHNWRAPAGRWIQDTHPTLAGKVATRDTAGNPERAR